MRSFATITFFLAGLLLKTGKANGQYTGGQGDGHAASSVNINLGIADSVFNGGAGDGVSFSTALVSLSITDSIYNGAAGDGCVQTNQPGISLSITDSIFNGGNGDGFHQMSVTGISLVITDSLYNGGIGKGDIHITQDSLELNVSCTGSVVYWNGSATTAWGNVSNWDCGALPGINSIVIIPAGKPKYPVITGSREVKWIIVQTGASCTISNGAELKLNGN